MIKHTDDDLHELVQDVAYWACVAIAALLTLAALFGVAGYVAQRWL